MASDEFVQQMDHLVTDALVERMARTLKAEEPDAFTDLVYARERARAACEALLTYIRRCDERIAQTARPG